ncbi:hypothetical protein D3C71_2060760 [compost metagenome]
MAMLRASQPASVTPAGGVSLSLRKDESVLAVAYSKVAPPLRLAKVPGIPELQLLER